MFPNFKILFLFFASSVLVCAQFKPKAGNICDFAIGNEVNIICEIQGLAGDKALNDLKLPKDVSTIRVIYSQIDDLPAIICDKYGSQLQVLEFQRSGLSSAGRNSVSNCTNLVVINLFGNNLRELPQELFSRNMKLTQIRLAENSIETLPDDIFRNNQDLELLDLSSNNLAAFSTNLVVGLKKLRTLILDANELMNLDVVALTREVEGLKTIYLDYNLFPCPVLEDVINYLNFTDVKSTGINNKARDDTLSAVSNIQCVNENVDEAASTGSGLENLVATTPTPMDEPPTQFLLKIPECVQCLEALFKLNCAKLGNLTESYMQFD